MNISIKYRSGRYIPQSVPKKKVQGQLVDNYKTETTCELSVDGTTYTASVKLFHKDKRDKNVARENAFKKALQQIESKEIRKHFWDAKNS